MKLLLPADKKTVTDVVCGHFNLSLKEFQSRSKKRDVVEARYIAWYVLTTVRGTSFSGLARGFDWHEDSIRYGLRTIAKWLPVDAKLAATVAVIESRCKILLEAA